jgi:hypothetical protein
MQSEKICHGLKTDSVKFGRVGRQASPQYRLGRFEKRGLEGVYHQLALARTAGLAHPANVGARWSGVDRDEQAARVAIIFVLPGVPVQNQLTGDGYARCGAVKLSSIIWVLAL